MSRKEQIKKLIFIHRRYLQTLEEKKAKYGLDVPPYILTEIDDEKAEIKKLQMTLKILENGHVTKETQKANSKQRIRIYLPKDFPSLSTDRRLAAIDAFAAVIGISPQAIEMYRKEV